MNHSRATPLPAFAAIVVVLSGCSPGFDAHYQTEHLEIETDFSAPLCAGDLDRWEALIVGNEARLGVELAPGLRLYAWDDANWPNGRWCPKGAIGCYSSSLHAIYTTLTASEHELVHAVAEGLGANQPLFDEGIAEALSDAPTFFGVTDPSSNLGLKTLEVDRRTAGHFVRWLWETEGPEPMQSLLTSAGDRAAFAAIYGFDLDEAEARYYDEAPWSYPPIFAHAVPELPEVAPGRWEEALDLDCAAIDVYGRPGGQAIVRTLTISTRGSYALWTDADGVSISQRQLAAVEDMEDAIASRQGDVSADMIVWRPGATVQVLDLAPATYELWVTDFDRDLDAAVLSVWPHLGPIPVNPEAP